MKAYKILSLTIITITLIQIVVIGWFIYVDYNDFKSCKSKCAYKDYIQKCKDEKIYPHIFLNKAIELYENESKNKRYKLVYFGYYDGNIKKVPNWYSIDSYLHIDEEEERITIVELKEGKMELNEKFKKIECNKYLILDSFIPKYVTISKEKELLHGDFYYVIKIGNNSFYLAIKQ